MSEAFGFMFSFYGLLLGLAVAEIASGFSRAYDERHKRKLGFVAPLFGALLLVDLITFWMNAWAYRTLPDINYMIAMVVALVALLYYFAATQVFPKASERETLDHHIMENRKVVVFCVLTSNLITQIPPLVMAVKGSWPVSEVLIWACGNLIYYALLLTAAFAKSKTVVGATVAFALVYVMVVTAIFA